MTTLFKLGRFANSIIVREKLCHFSTTNYLEQIAKPLLRPPPQSKVKLGPGAWFLLVIPASTFSLGVWQIQRKKWKENLLTHLQSRTNCDPVPLPNTLEEIAELEYKPVRVRGHFLHDKEMYLGPRSLLTNGDASTKSSLVTSKTNTAQGYLIVTPFKLADRDETILVNRGWVPVKNKDSRTRKNGQPEGIVDVLGVVRLNETRPTFSLHNQAGSNIWFYRDLESMCKTSGATPIFLDAANDFDVPEGPIGGQTRIALRNEHLAYILTWFSLCGATSYMWYKKFLIKK